MSINHEKGITDRKQDLGSNKGDHFVHELLNSH